MLSRSYKDARVSIQTEYQWPGLWRKVRLSTTLQTHTYICDHSPSNSLAISIKILASLSLIVLFQSILITRPFHSSTHSTIRLNITVPSVGCPNLRSSSCICCSDEFPLYSSSSSKSIFRARAEWISGWPWKDSTVFASFTKHSWFWAR